jgi:NAD(P)-dependent dehydrogenase (short-subunit alcohol dehydrogenase family)
VSLFSEISLGDIVSSKAIVITGANRGIGRAIAEGLAKSDTTIIMACRNMEISFVAAEEIRKNSGNKNIELMKLDLSSFESVHSFINEIERKGIQIDALINNAGVLCDSYQTTSDGYERTLQINYISQFLLTLLLVPHICKGEGQIINTSSIMYRFGKIDDSIFTRGKEKYNRFQSYADSKLASLLFSLELSERIKSEGIYVNSFDPGIVDTGILAMNNRLVDLLADLLFRPFIKTARRGAETSIYLAMADFDGKRTGKYYINDKERKLSSKYVDHVFKKELWDKTKTLLGI